MSDDVGAAPLPRPSLLPAGMPDARESDDAGRYYCAHALYLGHLAAERGHAPIVRDDDGDPLVGFLHVPPDARTRGAAEGAGDDDDRHRDLRAVVAAALAGWASPLARAVTDGPARVVVTGFGSFRDVVDNPTGAFVRSCDDVERTLRLAFGEELASCARDGDGEWLVSLDLEGARRELALCFRGLPVDDRCLSFDGEASLLALLEREARAHAWLGLGVCRSEFFRVETLPHDGGLMLDDDGGRHDGEREPRRFPRGSRALVRGIERGGVVVAARV